MIPVYFAPMEGVTEAVYRKAHFMCFPECAAYYLPFVSPTVHLCLNGREKRNVLPQYNAGMRCIPQVLTKDAEQFLWAAGAFADMGYTEVNLNAGCPSGTVTAKDKGAGLLKRADDLRRLLDRICSESPIPVSVKTRIGYTSPDEWEELLQVYASFPLRRLIIHPRTCRELYSPFYLHRECYEEALRRCPYEVIYNDDVFSPADAEEIAKKYPRTAGIMCGRGLVADPALAREIGGGERLKKEEVIRFHSVLTEELLSVYNRRITFMKLRVIMKMLSCAFENAEKEEKLIRKSRSLEELLEADRRLFENRQLKAGGAFVPDELKSRPSQQL